MSTSRWSVELVGIHISISWAAIASRAARGVVQRWSATSSPTNVASRRRAARPRRTWRRTGGDRRPASPIGRSARAGPVAGAGRAGRRCRRRRGDRRRIGPQRRRRGRIGPVRAGRSARSTPASSYISRTAATWSAAASPGSIAHPGGWAACSGSSEDRATSRASLSPGSTRPPGKTIIPAANAIVDGRRVRSTSSPAAPGRRRTTVAAGRGGAGSPVTGGGRRPIGSAADRGRSKCQPAKSRRSESKMPGSNSQSRSGSRRKPASRRGDAPSSSKPGSGAPSRGGRRPVPGR